MKKKNLLIASLLILSLCFVFFGCGETDPEEQDNSIVPSAIQDILKDMGYDGTLYTPAGSTYDQEKHFYGTPEDGFKQEVLIIVWKDCTEDTFNAYKDEWPSASITASINQARTYVEDAGFGLTLNANAGASSLPAAAKGLKARVGYTEEGGEDEGVTYAAGSIIFRAAVTIDAE